MADEDGIWRTISGRRIFIKSGQSLSDAMKESEKFGDSDNGGRTEDRENRRYELGREIAQNDKKYKEAYAEYERIQEEYIDALSAAKRGEKGKIKAKYEPLMDAAQKRWGHAANERQKAYSELKADIESGWGRTTVEAKGGKGFISGRQFIESKLEEYIRGK